MSALCRRGMKVVQRPEVQGHLAAAPEPQAMEVLWMWKELPGWFGPSRGMCARSPERGGVWDGVGEQTRKHII